MQDGNFLNAITGRKVAKTKKRMARKRGFIFALTTISAVVIGAILDKALAKEESTQASSSLLNNTINQSNLNDAVEPTVNVVADTADVNTFDVAQAANDINEGFTLTLHEETIDTFYLDNSTNQTPATEALPEEAVFPKQTLDMHHSSDAAETSHAQLAAADGAATSSASAAAVGEAEGMSTASKALLGVGALGGLGVAAGAGGGGGGSTAAAAAAGPVDLSPQVVNNVVETLDEGAEAIINQNELEYDDPDATDPSMIVYTLDATPQHGDLYLDNVPLSVGDTFTQADINSGLLRYDNTESGDAIIEDHTDSILFSVMVDGDADNVKENQTFTWTIEAVDDTPPTLENNEAVDVIVGDQSVVITTEMLQVVDSEQPPENINYTVDTAGAGSLLRLDVASDQLNPVTNFTQADIDAGLIHYAPAGAAIGGTTDNFQFSVNDGVAPTPNSLVSLVDLNINLVADTVAPSLDLNEVAFVESGEQVNLQNLLRYEDYQPTDDITYTVTVDPAQGQLAQGQLVGIEGVISTDPNGDTQFTQAELDAGLIFYQSLNGDAGGTVQFSFTVDDGQGNVTAPDTFTIEVSEGELHPMDQILVDNGIDYAQVDSGFREAMQSAYDGSAVDLVAEANDHLGLSIIPGDAASTQQGVQDIMYATNIEFYQLLGVLTDMDAADTGVPNNDPVQNLLSTVAGGLVAGGQDFDGSTLVTILGTIDLPYGDIIERDDTNPNKAIGPLYDLRTSQSKGEYEHYHFEEEDLDHGIGAGYHQLIEEFDPSVDEFHFAFSQGYTGQVPFRVVPTDSGGAEEGTADFSGTVGEVRWHQDGQDTLVQVDMNGDGDINNNFLGDSDPNTYSDFEVKLIGVNADDLDWGANIFVN